MAGGGLPKGRLAFRQPRNGAPMSGSPRFAPYTASAARGWRWRRSASTPAATDHRAEHGRFSTVRSPTAGCGRCACRSPGGSGAAAASPSGPPARWSASLICSPARSSSARRGCRSARSARRCDRKAAGGSARWARGSLAGAEWPARQFAAAARRAERPHRSKSSLSMRWRCGLDGRPRRSFSMLARLEGSFGGSGLAGTFSGALSTIGNVPLAMSDIAGKWRVYQRRLDRRRRPDVLRPGGPRVSIRSAVPISASTWPTTSSARTARSSTRRVAPRSPTSTSSTGC